MFIINNTEVIHCTIFAPSERCCLLAVGLLSDPVPNGAELSGKGTLLQLAREIQCPKCSNGMCVHRHTCEGGDVLGVSGLKS